MRERCWACLVAAAAIGALVAALLRLWGVL